MISKISQFSKKINFFKTFRNYQNVKYKQFVFNELESLIFKYICWTISNVQKMYFE